MGMQNLLVPHTVLAISLPEGTCSHSLCPPRDTRMAGRRNLPESHTKPIVGLPESERSRATLNHGGTPPYPLTGMLYPIDGNAEPASPAREADGRFVSEQMLAHSLLARAPAEGDTRMMERRNLSVLYAALFLARLTEQQNLSIPHAPLIANLPEITYSHILCPPHELSFCTPLSMI